ncbi:Gfo/Idh/MocA family protein [Actinoallomurus rhizosphaericola]|uniref:Gfo/Idh/MocA family protein n=1 Tax=Actinoallomurus rhizosphaericola TaxID=2952536 RepID=UPI002093DC36|nr:Gfo/Idh/MocA family oxidoreductase [Actinoallomurus rhizosphaericola]MCO5998089.1 Gfo/Idh/MocA family oxidoreductase [Actinoallomurus rhizosphaericola]
MDLRIGIVGAGFLTRHSLIPALRSVPNLRLAAVLDTEPEALRAVTAMCSDVETYTDEDAFFDAGLDAVHVATPNHLHEHFAVRALDCGLATLIDKPLAHMVTSAQRILAVAAKATAPALVGYMSKYNVYNREARRLVRSGAIGAPRAMSAARLGWRKYDWRSRRRFSGLGCLADLGIYPVLTAIDLFGEDPVRCQGTLWPVNDPECTDLHAQATLWFDDRRYLQFKTAATFNEEPASAEVSAYTLVGEEGIIQVRDSWAMSGAGHLELCDGGGWHRADLVPTDPYAEQYRLLAECAAGAPVPEEVGLARGLADLEILYAIADNAAGAGGVTPIRHSPAGNGTEAARS